LSTGFFVLVGEGEGDGEGLDDADPAAPDGSGTPPARVVGLPLGMNRLGFWVAPDVAPLMPVTFAAPSATTLTTPPMTSDTATRTPMPTRS
jgi:hypothetical protein